MVQQPLTMPQRRSALSMLGQPDIALALMLMLILGMMIIPMPPMALDMLLALNISISIVILLVSIYMREPLDFSVFPTLLLVTTLFRLALNVSSTRQILLHAHAGEIIKSFGNFVVGGSLIVGIVIFIILLVIQFVVITNGAGRVAEVAARFTLDAMPGKQMGVDADLNAGLIDEKEARKRRAKIANEADFYGAMDGASKFVKGDAIAGLITVGINLIGGMGVGVFQKGMGIGEAVQTFSLLTIGDGLVGQIPALLISTATGIIVTRANSDGNLGSDMAQQMFSHPRTMFVSAAIMAGFGIIPGLPKVPFFAFALIIGGAGYMVQKSQKKAALQAEVEASEQEQQEAVVVDNVVNLLPLDPLEVELGYSLLSMVEGRGSNLLDRITTIRRQLALDMGVIVPTVRVRDNLMLEPNAYVVKLRGVEVGRGELFPQRYLAMSAGAPSDGIEGIDAIEPAFGLPAIWVDNQDRDRAELMGHTVVDAQSVLATHLTEVFRRHASDLLSRQDVQHLLNTLKADYPAVVDDLTGGLMTLGEIQRVLQNLLAERVSVRDLLTICETLATHARITKDPEVLTEQVRLALSRAICSSYMGEDRVLQVLTLNPTLEQTLVTSIQQTDQGPAILVDPALANRVLSDLSNKMEMLAALGRPPVLLCSGRLRRPFRRLAERVLPGLVVLAFGEVTADTDVQAVGMVDGEA